MASKNSEADPFQPDQVSLSVSADDALQFLEDHGFFYQGNTTIGEIVDYLYSNNLVRDTRGRFSVDFEFFRTAIQRDPRLGKILNHYPIPTHFRFPFGTTPSYHNWAPEHGAVIVCILSSESQWWCPDGSHKLESKGEVLGHGGLDFPEDVLGGCPKREVNMKRGGVLFMLPGLAVREVTGRSFLYGRRKEQASAP